MFRITNLIALLLATALFAAACSQSPVSSYHEDPDRNPAVDQVDPVDDPPLKDIDHRDVVDDLSVFEIDAPTGLIANAPGDCKVHLSWTDNSDSETAFSIERKDAAGDWTELAIVEADSTKYVDETCAENAAYTYRVFAYNRKATSEYSEVAAARATFTVPAAPSNLRLPALRRWVRGSTEIVWDDNSQNEDAFEIYRWTYGSGFGRWQRVGRVDSPRTSFRETGLLSGAAYTYSVRAVNGKGASRSSETLTVTAL